MLYYIITSKALFIAYNKLEKPMKEFNNLHLDLLNEVFSMLNIAENETNHIDFDEIRKKIERIKEIEKSNYLYQQRLKKIIKSKERKIDELTGENSAVKTEIKNYLINRMRLLNYPEKNIFSLLEENDGKTMIKLKHKIDKEMKEEFKLELNNVQETSVITNYRPYKLKEV